ncbi:hypothetical protein [Streptomyces sp. NPDC048202]|uniref:hypothetical protein n=1 Tax=Streptomyces sp. NPDC048202 TaxID=3365514 RepID=UPI00370F828B
MFVELVNPMGVDRRLSGGIHKIPPNPVGVADTPGFATPGWPLPAGSGFASRTRQSNTTAPATGKSGRTPIRGRVRAA